MACSGSVGDDRPSKSVLDGIPKNTKSFDEGMARYKGDQPHRTIVGACPSCGSPIYGSHVLLPGDTPVVTRSCLCVSSAKTITDRMETK